MTGFYVDAQEQREKARAMDAALRTHNERRALLQAQYPEQYRRPRYEPDNSPRMPFSTPDYDENPTAPPPVFYTDHGPQRARTTSIERRASRFRDGLPPPPPPTPEELSGIQRVLPPGPSTLIPQHEFDNGYPDEERMRRGPPSTGLIHGPDAFRMPLPPAIGWESPAMPSLSKSQRKRLKRNEKKQARRAAPYPLPQDTAPHANGNGVAHIPLDVQQELATTLPAPLPPFPDEPSPAVPLKTACEAEVIITHLVRGIPVDIRLVCPLRPFPHPGQPHLMQLNGPDGYEVFIGWYGPGE